MRSITSIAGAVLIVLGFLVLTYQGLSYTKHETVAQIGNVTITSENRERVYLPPIAGGLSIVAGIALVVIGRKR